MTNPERTFRLMTVLISLIILRFMIVPQVSEYKELRNELKLKRDLLEEAVQEKDRLKKMEREIEKMKNTVKKLQVFLIPPDILSVEKRAETRRCLEDDLCYFRKTYVISFSTTYEEILYFVKEMKTSMSITDVRKLEISRTPEGIPETKMEIEVVEVSW